MNFETSFMGTHAIKDQPEVDQTSESTSCDVDDWLEAYHHGWWCNVTALDLSAWSELTVAPTVDMTECSKYDMNAHQH